MKKFNKNDIQLLGEGPLIRKIIKERYNDVKEFYTEKQINMELSSFRTYLSRDVITSETFKCIVTMALDIDYNNTVISKLDQLKDFVKQINDNIREYNEEEDQETLDLVLEYCKKEELITETAFMYRAKASNFYYIGKINHAEEFYEYAINSLPNDDINLKTFFYCELADYLFQEDLLDKAEKIYKITDDYVRWYKQKLDNQTLFNYYYGRGMMYSHNDNISDAHVLFKLAIDYAPRNFHKASAISNIGLTYKRQKMYDKALNYYEQALKLYDESNILTTASIYNNIAVLYKTIADNSNALVNIKKALSILELQDNITKRLIYTETYVEIQMAIGCYQSYKTYFKVLLDTKGKQLHKPDTIFSIKAFIHNTANKQCLTELVDIILELKNASASSGFIQGLYECLGLITEKTHNK